MALGKAPYNEASLEASGKFTVSWQKWFDRVSLLLTSNESGTTANRPTTGLYVGRRYFDTTLGKPVWVKNVSTPVWVDGAGTTV